MNRTLARLCAAALLLAAPALAIGGVTAAPAGGTAAAGVSSINGQQGAVTLAIPSIVGLMKTTDAQAAFQPAGPYALSSDILGFDTVAARQADTAAVRAVIPSTAGLLTTASGGLL